MTVVSENISSGMDTFQRMYGDDHGKHVECLIRLFSETTYRTGYSQQGVDEAAIKTRIFELVKTHPDIAKSALEGNQFEHQKKLEDVIDRINYLSKDKFINAKAGNWYLWGTRFSHHLGRNLGTLGTMSKGAAYFAAGITIEMLGLAQLDTNDPAKKANVGVGIPAVIIGIPLIASPFISAFQLAKEGNP